MDLIRTLLEQQPLMALFLTIAIGYLVGEIDIKGFSLGVGAVLFVALAVGWFAPKAVPAAMVGTLGLALFLYAVGIQYGKQFVLGLTSAAGRRANLIALVGVLSAGDREPAHRKNDGPESRLRPRLVRRFGDEHADSAGGHRDTRQRRPGSGLLGVLPDRRGRADPVSLLRVHDPQAEDRRPRPSVGMEMLEIALRNPDHFGRTLGEVMSGLPPQVKIVALRTGHHNQPAGHGHIVAENDVVLVVAPDKEVLEQARRNLGEAASGRVFKDRSDLDYLRVFASRPSVVGRPARRSRAAGRQGGGHRPSPPRRHQHPAAPRPRARVRRPRRPARPSGRLFGAAQVLRRFDQGHRGVQLRLHRSGHGARLAPRRDPDSAARHRQPLCRPVGCLDRGAGPGQPAAHAAASTGPFRCRPTSCCATWGSRCFSRRSGWLRGPSSPRR